MVTYNDITRPDPNVKTVCEQFTWFYPHNCEALSFFSFFYFLPSISCDFDFSESIANFVFHTVTIA